MEAVKTTFSSEEISTCKTQEQLKALLNRAASREVLYRTFSEFGLTYAGLQFCTKEKLACYLASELLILMKRKPLRRKVRLIDKLSEGIALSFSGATLAGMMIFMLML